MADDRIAHCSEIPWVQGSTEGLTFSCQVLFDGVDGGPEALRFRFDPTPSVYAHMHLSSQFQLVIGGRMRMPRGIELGPLDVHYTDHCVPYGPFAVDSGHDMLVLHPQPGGLLALTDTEARSAINLRGRLLVGSAQSVDWADPGSPIRHKRLIPSEAGPGVSLVECAPDSALVVAPPEFGRYEVLLSGSAQCGSHQLEALSLRYVDGSSETEPLCAGPEGASVMLLSFDADAKEGGLDGGAIALRAASGLERAI